MTRVAIRNGMTIKPIAIPSQARIAMEGLGISDALGRARDAIRRGDIGQARALVNQLQPYAATLDDVAIACALLKILAGSATRETP